MTFTPYTTLNVCSAALIGGMGVVKQVGNAVGRGNAYAHPTEVGHHRVDTVETVAPLNRAERFQPPAVDGRHHIAMHLMGIHQMPRTDTEQPAKRCPVGLNVGGIVAAMEVDVERGIVAPSDTAVTGGTESTHSGPEVILVKYRLRHGLIQISQATCLSRT